MQGESEVDSSWERPEDPGWGPFHEAALEVFDTWDVLERAVEEEWGGEDSEYFADKIVDDVLANYAERWIAKRDTREDAVAEYLVEEFDEKFRCDLDYGVALPLARVINTLYNECRYGDFKGVQYILGKRDARMAAARGAAAPPAATPAVVPGGAAPQSDANMTDAPASSARAAPEPDPDGWTVVSTKKRR